MEKHFPRLIENYLADLLVDLPAFSIDGLKGIGKTVSASKLAKTSYRLDSEHDHLLLSNNMELLLEAERPVLLDEWQRLPAVWDFIRRAVDDDQASSRYLLTGSIFAKDLDVHSGAGRIIRLRMFPLSLEERGLDRKTVSLAALFAQAVPGSLEIRGETAVTLGHYLEEIALSGLPGMRMEDERRRRLVFGSYLDSLLSHDFAQEGVRVRQPQALKRWLTSYAAAIASTADYNLILRGASAGAASAPSAKTTIAYREALERLWLIDELPAWLDGENYYSRLKRAPRHYLADPAFAVHLLDIGIDSLLPKGGGHFPETRFDERYGNIVGRLFDALVFQSLRAYAAVNEAGIHYFHTEKGERKIDFIVTQGAKTVAIEVKAAPSVKDGDVRHLVWLRDAMGDRLTDALIVNTGPVAYRRPDGIAVVPAALLGA
jgi:predicted AAA+ superfamily ATPase